MNRQNILGIKYAKLFGNTNRSVFDQNAGGSLRTKSTRELTNRNQEFCQ
jgi:hypothetical protein